MRSTRRGPGKRLSRRARSGWPFDYVRAWEVAVDLGSGSWEVAGNSVYAGVALEVRSGLNTLSLLSRGRPALVQAGVGALGLGLRYSGRVVRGDWGYSVGGLG